MNREVVFFDGRDKDCLWEGLEIFLSKHHFTLSGESHRHCLKLTGIPWEEACLKVVKSGNECKIFYREKAHFSGACHCFCRISASMNGKQKKR